MEKNSIYLSKPSLNIKNLFEKIEQCHNNSYNNYKSGNSSNNSSISGCSKNNSDHEIKNLKAELDKLKAQNLKLNSQVEILSTEKQTLINENVALKREAQSCRSNEMVSLKVNDELLKKNAELTNEKNLADERYKNIYTENCNLELKVKEALKYNEQLKADQVDCAKKLEEEKKLKIQCYNLGKKLLQDENKFFDLLNKNNAINHINNNGANNIHNSNSNAQRNTSNNYNNNSQNQNANNVDNIQSINLNKDNGINTNTNGANGANTSNNSSSNSNEKPHNSNININSNPNLHSNNGNSNSHSNMDLNEQSTNSNSNNNNNNANSNINSNASSRTDLIPKDIINNIKIDEKLCEDYILREAAKCKKDSEALKNCTESVTQHFFDKRILKEKLENLEKSNIKLLEEINSYVKKLNELNIKLANCTNLKPNSDVNIDKCQKELKECNHLLSVNNNLNANANVNTNVSGNTSNISKIEVKIFLENILMGPNECENINDIKSEVERICNKEINYKQGINNFITSMASTYKNDDFFDKKNMLLNLNRRKN